MRIEYVRLKGFEGLERGSGIADLELDLGGEGPLFCMLSGANGSGKSTVLNSLHPGHGTGGDGRKPVPEGREGYKELRVRRDDGALFVVRHWWDRRGSVRSFLEKDGDELNPNGGVKTFQALARRELGFDEDSLVVRRLGPNAATFADLPPSQRKDYVVRNLLSGIDEYLEAWGRAKERHAAMKARAKGAGDQLARLEPEADLDALLRAAESRLAAAESDAARAAADAASALGDLERFAGKLDEAEAAAREAGADAAAEALGKAAADCEEALAGCPVAREMNGAELDEAVEVAVSEEASLREEAASLAATARALAAAASESASRASSLRSVSSRRVSSPASEASLAAEIARLEGLLPELPASDGKPFPSEAEAAAALRAATRAAEAISAARAGVPDGPLRKAVASGPEAVAGTLSAARKAAAAAAGRLEEASRKLAQAEGARDIAAALGMRPPACRIDSCSFIAGALQASKVLEGLPAAEKELGEASLEDSGARAWAELAAEASRHSAELRAAGGELAACAGFLRWAGRSGLASPGWASSALLAPSHDVDALLDLSAAADLCSGLAERARSEARLAEAREALDAGESARAAAEEAVGFLAEAERDEAGKSSDAARAASEAAEAAGKARAAGDRAAALRRARDARAALATASAAERESRGLLTKWNDAWEAHERAVGLLVEKEERSAVLTSAVPPLREAAGRCAARLERRRELSAELAEVEKELGSLELVARALDPKRGIPMAYGEDALEAVRGDCNALLAHSFGGGLQVLGFQLGEREFRIRVSNAGGGVLDDVSLASQGERALVTLALSLAVAGRAGGWSVLSLDEADGPLDSENRESFLEMVRQMSASAGIRQVFVISHNDCFRHELADLVLLRGSEFDPTDPLAMDGKRVLLDAR